MAKVSVNVKMDESLRDEARVLLNDFGLDMTTAVNLFLRAVIRDKAIPFQIGSLNSDLLKQLLWEEIRNDLLQSEKDLAAGKLLDFDVAMRELRDTL